MEEENSVTIISFQRGNRINLRRQRFDSMFSMDGSRHPQILKEHLSGRVSLETMVILDGILGYKSKWDKSLTDPVWETVSMKMRKYSPFLNIDVPRYKNILKKVVLGDK